MKKIITLLNPKFDERWEIKIWSNGWATWKSNNSEGSKANLQTHTLEDMEIEAVEEFKKWIGEEEFAELEREY